MNLTLIGNFLVFQCKRCRKFLYAPVTQKTRFCPYCQKVTPVPRDQVQLCNSASTAGELVRQYNGGHEIAEFVTAADKSREEIQRLLIEFPKVDAPKQHSNEIESTGTQKELLGLLAKFAISNPISFDDFQQKCLQNDLSWEWVKEQLSNLAQQGIIYFPEMWTIQYLPAKSSSAGKIVGLTDSIRQAPSRPIPAYPGKSQLRKQIQQILENASSPMALEEIHEKTSPDVSISELEEVIREFLQQGFIYEPRPNVFVLI